MAAAVPFIPLAMQAVGTVVQGIGANAEHRAAARADAENGRLSLLAGNRDIEDIMRQAREQAGEALTELGGSGVLVGTGTAADIIAQSAVERDRDIATRREQALGERANYLRKAKDERAAGRNALITSAFTGAAQVLGGVRDIRNQRIADRQRQEERRVILGNR